MFNQAQNAKLKSQSYNSKGKTELKYRAYKFSLTIIRFISSLPQNKLCWTIGNQLLRSGTSIGANIIEAQSASSKRDFVKFYEISLKSANETKYWLCLLRDSNIIEEKGEIEKVLNEAVEISRILGASILTLKGKKQF
jgi:four helix bundle protein